MKIAVFSTKNYDRQTLGAINTDHELTFFEARLNAQTTNLTEGFDGVCVFVNDKLDRLTISQIAENGVGLIALRSAGFNNIDLKAAAKHNVRVLRVPAYSPEAVAEHALALILTLNRKTHKAYNRVREGNFSLEKLTGFTLSSKTVGVIGTGKIGIAFCKIMQGLGCEVFAYDPYPKDEVQKMGVEYLSLSDLLRYSNIVSLHCPLTPETHHLINADTLNEIQAGTMLINTSRGALVDTAATIGALKDGTLSHLGIDVYEQEEHLFFKDLSEEIIQDDIIARLISLPNVLITAHQGFFTEEALHEIAETTVANFEAFAKGEESKNEVKVE